MKIYQALFVMLAAFVIVLVNSYVFCYGWNHFVVAINFVLAQHVENSASIITAVFIPKLTVPIVFGIMIMKGVVCNGLTSLTITSVSQFNSYFIEKVGGSLIAFVVMYIAVLFL